jgi:hypothetical protein
MHPVKALLLQELKSLQANQFAPKHKVVRVSAGLLQDPIESPESIARLIAREIGAEVDCSDARLEDVIRFHLTATFP